MAANFSCRAFSSIDQVLVQADTGELNITAFAKSCPNVCTLAWGIGNPDLSGIGTNISYILQAALTILFGPLFCLAYAIYKPDSERWEKLQNQFHDISAQFTIPVAVAAIVRYHQHASFYEIDFLHSLLTMQFFSLLSSSVVAGVFAERKSITRIIVLVIYGLLDFALYMVLVGDLITSQPRWQTLNDLGEACSAYNHIFPWIQHIPTPNVLPHITAKQFFKPFNKTAWKFGLILFGFIVAGIIGLVLAVVILGMLFKALTSKDARFLGLISLGLSVGMLVEVVQMERTRNIMEEVTGLEFLDNEWGFGQIISLFLWVPLGLQSIYNVIGILNGD
ncbi:hypothetical protein BDN70DRAFT_375182 [Pholiota conissans]|uniref:Uncharacterized protein n=1 Tax=Pholiota conissans TaxID=109636 RepID=A0A9P6D4V4_9AGAR|nr:hypothetical protein BDN70DRAFT_375182 [Pholiota conissans]